jgi:hypothetical protein
LCLVGDADISVVPELYSTFPITVNQALS